MLFNGNFLTIVRGIMKRARSFLLRTITFTLGLLKSSIFVILWFMPGLNRSYSAPSLIVGPLSTPSSNCSYYPFTYRVYQQSLR